MGAFIVKVAGELIRDALFGNAELIVAGKQVSVHDLAITSIVRIPFTDEFRFVCEVSFAPNVPDAEVLITKRLPYVIEVRRKQNSKP
jgi:hypothetical protein